MCTNNYSNKERFDAKLLQKYNGAVFCLTVYMSCKRKLHCNIGYCRPVVSRGLNTYVRNVYVAITVV